MQQQMPSPHSNVTVKIHHRGSLYVSNKTGLHLVRDYDVYDEKGHRFHGQEWDEKIIPDGKYTVPLEVFYKLIGFDG